jgi:hypothetical protein
MKKVLFLIAICFASYVLNAQSYKETFDSNSLEWTECTFKKADGTAIIDKGVMTLKSKEVKDLRTFFETHCYAPLNMSRSFTVVANVKVKVLDDENAAGFVFNYRDNGNYYVFSFDKSCVTFARFVDRKVVGRIMQNVKWAKKGNVNQQWKLVYDAHSQQIEFFVDDMPIMKVRHMPLEYTGFGFYTFGKQELTIDDIEFIQ